MSPATNPDLDALCERLEKYRGGDCGYRALMDEAAATIRSLREQVKVAKVEGMREAAEIARKYAPGVGGSPLWTDAAVNIAAAIRNHIEESRDG